MVTRTTIIRTPWTKKLAPELKVSFSIDIPLLKKKPESQSSVAPQKKMVSHNKSIVTTVAESGRRNGASEFEDEDSITRSTEFSKKAFSRTHLDLKLSMQDVPNKNDLSDIKNNRDNSLTKNTAQDEKNTTQKVSLQQFVTKVNKGKIPHSL